MIAFGWAVGDIAVAIKLILKVSKAFKEGRGAVAEYEKSVAFLDNLKLSLDALKDYIGQNPDAKYSIDIATQLQKLGLPLTCLKDYMQGYEAFEKQNAHKKRVLRATKVIKWTLKNLSGEVSRLEAAVTGPLQSIQLLFSQQMLCDITSARADLQKVATSVEAVRSDVQNLRLDVSDSKNAIDKPGGILAQGLQNADLSRKIITSIEELGNAFSLRHDLGLVNATALSAQLDMLDRLHSSVATEEREMEEEAISPEDEIEGHVSDISETIAGQENGCTSLRLNETDMELLEKFRKALQESVDGLEQIQAHKAAVGEDFTNTAVKETQLSQLRQLAMFLASSFVAGLAAAMAAKDWDRPSRVVDWRKEWVQVYWHEERAQVNWHKERTQADHAIIDQKNPSAATVSPDYQDATPPVVRSLRQPKVHVQQKLESIPPSLWECCHCTHWSSSVVRPTSCENPKCRHYTASCRTCLERNKVRLNLSSYDRRLDGSDWNGHGHGYSHAELSGVFDDVWEQSTEKDDDDADAHGSKNDLKQDDGDKDSKNSEDRPISDSDKKDGMGGYKKQGDNQERPRPPFSSKLEYAIMS